MSRLYGMFVTWFSTFTVIFACNYAFAQQSFELQRIDSLLQSSGSLGIVVGATDSCTPEPGTGEQALIAASTGETNAAGTVTRDTAEGGSSAEALVDVEAAVFTPWNGTTFAPEATLAIGGLAHGQGPNAPCLGGGLGAWDIQPGGGGTAGDTIAQACFEVLDNTSASNPPVLDGFMDIIITANLQGNASFLNAGTFGGLPIATDDSNFYLECGSSTLQGVWDSANTGWVVTGVLHYPGGSDNYLEFEPASINQIIPVGEETAVSNEHCVRVRADVGSFGNAFQDETATSLVTMSFLSTFEVTE